MRVLFGDGVSKGGLFGLFIMEFVESRGDFLSGISVIVCVFVTGGIGLSMMGGISVYKILLNSG